QPGTGKVRAIEAGVGEASPAQDGMAKLGAFKPRLVEVGRAQVDTRHLGLAQSRLGQIAAPGARTPARATAVKEEKRAEISTAHRGAAQIGARETGTVQIGTRHVRPV